MVALSHRLFGFNDLPEELLYNILERKMDKQLLTYLCVCKTWRRILGTINSITVYEST